MKELAKRTIVAVIGIPISIGLIYIGNFPFFLFLLILSNLTLREFYNLGRIRNYSPFAFFGYILNSVLLILSYAFLNGMTNFEPLQIAIIAFILIYSSPFFLLILQIWSKKQKVTENFAITLSGAIFINFGFLSILMIRSLPLLIAKITELGLMPKITLTIHQIQINDTWAFLFFITILGAIWICDSFAYFVGSALGKHKLAPKVSPKKSWEGATAGLAGAFLAIFLFDYLFALSIKFNYLVLFSFVVALMGQTGDLAESKIKRDFNVKDSSNILPGHGGLLDRLDSILFIYPTLLAIFLLFLL